MERTEKRLALSRGIALATLLVLVVAPFIAPNQTRSATAATRPPGAALAAEITLSPSDASGYVAARAELRASPTLSTASSSPDGPRGCVRGGTRSPDGMIRSHPTSSVWISHYRRSGPKGPIAVIGDSLTEGIYADLAQALHKKGWGPICVNAGRSRFIARAPGRASGEATLSSLRRSHRVWRSANVTWVIALGTNDAGLSSVQADFNGMVRLVGKVRSLHWVDVRTHRGGHHSADEQEFNRLIARNDRVRRIRWARLVEANPRYLSSDGIHLSSKGERPRISLIAKSVG